MLLSHNEILEILRQGVVEGALTENVNGSSLDIRLGDTVMIECEKPEGTSRLLDLRARQKPDMYPLVMEDNGYIVDPGEFILAHSIEVFNLPLDMSCEFKLKSSLARIGVNQLTACWCDPGWNGSTITLELNNTMRWHSVRIRPGDKVGQMVFFRHTPVPLERSYAKRGRYNNDKIVSGIKL